MRMEKEQRKKYWEKARLNGWSAASAARDLGPQVKAKSFQAVITNGYQSGELAPAVDDWLVENADRKPGRGIRKPKQIPPGDILGNKLISVGGTLISSKFDGDHKIKTLRRFFEEFVSDFPAYIRALEESEKSNP